MPQISRSVDVIVPAYNAEKTLAATLDSVVEEVGVDRIVVIDDGSVDATLSVAETYRPRVDILTGPNRGVSAARNLGIAKTNSNWLLFLDSDDLLKPGTVESRVKVAEATGASVVICDWQEIIDDGNGSTTDGEFCRVAWKAIADDAQIATATHVWATTAAILYRRDLVQRIGGFRSDLPVIQDARLLFDAAYFGARFAYDPHVGAQYRIMPGSLCRRNPARFYEDILVNGQQIEACWRERGNLSAAQRDALAAIYDTAARGLFLATHERYFEAISSRGRLGVKSTLHGLIATPLAHVLGLYMACRILRMIGRT